MTKEQQALKRLAKARKQVKHAMTQHGEHYHGQSIDCIAFRFALEEAIQLGNTIESEEAVEGEIKLGWYRSETDGYTRVFELLAIRGEMACLWNGHGCFTIHINVIRKREYLGTERPPKGTLGGLRSVKSYVRYVSYQGTGK